MPKILDQIKTYAMSWKKKTYTLLSDLQEKFGKERSFIGIDIGVSTVKAIEMADINGVMTVVKSAIADIDGDLNNDQAVINSLKAAVKGMAPDEARVVAMINCPETCTRRIIAPNMPKKELADAVRW